MSDKCIRVLQIGMTSFPGGMESYIMNLYRTIDRSKVQFDFLGYKGTTMAYEDEVREMGGRVFYDYVEIRKSPWLYFKGVANVLKEHPEISIVHLHALSITNVLIMLAVKKRGVKTRIIHAHQGGETKKDGVMKGFIKKFLQKYLDFFVSDCFACGKKAGKWMYGTHVFEVKNNAIDLDSFQFDENIRVQYRKKLKVEEAVDVLGTVGRIDEQKNPFFLLEVFKNYHQNLNKKSILVLIGTGNLEEPLKKKAMEYQLADCVQFLGVQKNVNHWLQAMDVFLLPSIFEGFPFVLVEAQATDLPCIISSKISQETKLLDKTIFLDITSSEDILIWGESIKNCTKVKDRKKQDELLRDKGFCIQDQTKKTEDFYRSKAIV